MKHTHLSQILGLPVLLGLGGCGMFGGERSPEVTNAARLNIAMAAEAAGDNQMALQIYATALAKDPSDTKAAVQYARALVNNRQVGLARELLSRQLAARPGQPDLSREFGTIEVLQGQPGPALARFDTALLANPQDVRAMVNKGIALDMLGRHGEAQDLYRRADSLSPDDPAVRSNLAMSLMLSGQAQQAADIMQNMGLSADNIPRVRNNMAVMAAANGDMARARRLTSGEISETELQALAGQLRSAPQQMPAPVSQVAPEATPIAAAPAPVPVAAAPMAAPAMPVSVAPTPVSTDSGAVPLTVPGQSPAATTPRAVPTRAQDKRGAGRLNMTEAAQPVTPAEVARVIELAMEKEAAFIGQGPSADLTPRLPVMAAVASTPLRVRPAMPEAASAPAVIPAVMRPAVGPRLGYSVQLAAVDTETGARGEWRRISNRLPFLLSGRDALVDQVSRADWRQFWRLRTPGFTEFADARQFCVELKLSGQDCFVSGGRPRATPVVAPKPMVAPEAQSPEG